MGQLQGMGRHRAVSDVRAGARALPLPPHGRGIAMRREAADVESTLRARLARLSPSVLEIHDDSAEHAGHAGAAGGGHFSLLIVSNVFFGLTRLARHQCVLREVADL